MISFLESTTNLPSNDQNNLALVKCDYPGMGRTRLHSAAGYGRIHDLMECIQNGEDPNLCSVNGRTPLHEACQSGHLDCVQYLLEHCDPLVIDHQGRTVAHLAASNGELLCLKTLHEYGVPMNSLDNMKKTICQLAAERDHVCILEFVEPSLLDVEDIQGRTTLHVAASFGAMKCIRYLMTNDHSQYKEDRRSGALPVHHAAANNRLDALRLFIKHGISREVSTLSDGRSLLHVAAAHGSKDVIHWLANTGADIMKQDFKGNTPLHLAACFGHAHSYNCLLTQAKIMGLDPQMMTNSIGDTTLQSAKKSGHPILIQKAVDSVIRCNLCKTKEDSDNWKKKHSISAVYNDVSIIKKKSTKRYVEELSCVKGLSNGRDQKIKIPMLPPRELTAQFIGDHTARKDSTK